MKYYNGVKLYQNKSGKSTQQMSKKSVLIKCDFCKHAATQFGRTTNQMNIYIASIFLINLLIQYLFVYIIFYYIYLILLPTSAAVCIIS